MRSGVVDAGVFVAAFVLLFIAIAQGWMMLAAICAAVLVGVMVVQAARRQQSGEKPVQEKRPWDRGT